MAYNESQALKWQLLYRFSKEERYFQKLFLECFAISLMITKSALKRYHLSFPQERVYDIAVDATARLLERIKGTPGYHISVFRSALYFEVKYALHNKKAKDYDTFETPLLDDHYQIPSPERDYEEDVRTPLEDILELPGGKRIVITCYRSSSYKKFILRISEFIPKRVIYSYACRLHLLYKHTRLGSWSRRSKQC